MSAMAKSGRALRVIVYLLVLLGWETGSLFSHAQLKAGAPATVTLRVVDSYGKPLEYKVEDFHAKDQPDANLAGQFEGLTFKHAVQGKIYEFRLAPVSPGAEHPAFRQSVAVGESSTLAVFSVPKAILSPDRDTPWPVTKLVIRPAPHSEDLWVNARPAYASDISGMDTSETASVNPDGSFKLHGTHGGLYVITIYKGSTILKLAIMDIPQFAPAKPIEVKLNGDR
jgi:hypothetical protein